MKSNNIKQYINNIIHNKLLFNHNNKLYYYDDISIIIIDIQKLLSILS